MKDNSQPDTAIPAEGTSDIQAGVWMLSLLQMDRC
jgi:hypothetical protein